MTPKTEPVVTAAAIIGLIMSVIAFLVGRGHIDWSPEDMSGFAEILSYAVPMLFVVAGGVVARHFTTPVARPQLDKDTPLMTAQEWKALDYAERGQQR